MIKRTDSTGDWYLYDSARGIVAGNDPYVFLNATDAEVTNTITLTRYLAALPLHHQRQQDLMRPVALTYF